MKKSEWDIAQSRALYNIEHWGEEYFDINQNGEITVSPTPKQSAISLYQLTQDLKNKGFSCL